MLLSFAVQLLWWEIFMDNFTIWWSFSKSEEKFLIQITCSWEIMLTVGHIVLKPLLFFYFTKFGTPIEYVFYEATTNKDKRHKFMVFMLNAIKNTVVQPFGATLWKCSIISLLEQQWITKHLQCMLDSAQLFNWLTISNKYKEFKKYLMKDPLLI